MSDKEEEGPNPFDEDYDDTEYDNRKHDHPPEGEVSTAKKSEVRLLTS